MEQLISMWVTMVKHGGLELAIAFIIGLVVISLVLKIAGSIVGLVAGN